MTPRYSVSSTSNSHFSAFRKKVVLTVGVGGTSFVIRAVFRLILCEDEDVVEVDGHLSLSDEVAEDVVHHPLERGGRIGEPEEHDSGLVQAPVRAEGGLLLVSLP